MGQALFPNLSVGRMAITPLSSSKTFSIECTGLNTAERDKLVGFFIQMQGRFGSFRLEYGDIVFPLCGFDSDIGPWIENGPGPHGLTFSIKVLSYAREAA
jgi:hypothetical protein